MMVQIGKDLKRFLEQNADRKDVWVSEEILKSLRSGALKENLNIEEEGIKVLDRDRGKYKIYSKIYGILFYTLSDIKFLF